MKLEYEGHDYYLKEELTGRDWMEIRQKSRNAMGDLDFYEYGYRNLLCRLYQWSRTEELNEESIRNLPLSIFQLLNNVALRLEGQETESANNFFLTLWPASSQEEQRSRSRSSRKRNRDGHEQSIALVQPESG
jgi:hypothetical protein